MDIRDLKIGDKVLSPDGEIITVIAMGRNVICYEENEYYAVKHLDPIPLTDELLDKIGFKEVGNSPNDGIDYELSDNLYNKTDICYCKIWHTLIKENSYTFNIHTGNSSKNILYVHQLQHELWDNNIKLDIKI